MKITILLLLVGAFVAPISQGAAITQASPLSYNFAPADAGSISTADEDVEEMKKKKKSKKKKKKSRAS
jgi:hypothetical protein